MRCGDQVVRLWHAIVVENDDDLTGRFFNGAGPCAGYARRNVFPDNSNPR